MGKQNNIDNIIKDAYAGKTDGINDFTNMRIPDIKSVFEKFERNLADDDAAKSLHSAEVKTKGKIYSFLSGFFTKPAYGIAAGFAVMITVIVVLSLSGYLPIFRSPPNNEIVTAVNPLKRVETLQAAEKEVGFAVSAPGYMAAGYTQEGIYVVNVSGLKKWVRQIYTKGESRIILEKSYSGNDQAKAEGGKTIDISGKPVYITDADGQISASWIEGEFYYLITAPDDVSGDDLESMAAGFR